ncbi:M20 peptidase aminoacylase family protein [Paenibacillus ginsengarvi]|nr:M20 peptidase aminoacylase family protein [Paenibacillus ginsengarvi]
MDIGNVGMENLSVQQRIKQWPAEQQALLETTYRELHELAEVSWSEVNTNAYLCRALDRIGVSYETFPDQTGVVAIWDEGVPGPTVGLRADIDALPHEWKGKQLAIHSCGHDAHMTIVLHTLSCLKQCGFRPQGRLKLLFQPAEETGDGALSFIRKGVIDDVDYLLSLHVRPIQDMPYGKSSAAIYHGSAVQMRGEIKGVQAHAARPHLGVNVIDALAAIVQAVNAVRSNPLVPSSAKVTQAAAGSTINIIPDYASFGIDLRAQTNEAMDDLIRGVVRAVQAAGAANGAEVSIAPTARMVAAMPNAAMEAIVGQAIREALGDEAFHPPVLTSGGEDFHQYALAKPGLATTMVGLGAGLSPGLHHPEMSFNLGALQHGVAIMATAVTKLFDQDCNPGAGKESVL